MDAIKNTILICLFATAQYTLVAQQSPQYSLYMFNKFAVSPAYAGLDEQIVINGLIRQQWNGLTGSPRTQLFSTNAPVGILHGGIGITAQHQSIGAHRQTSAKLSYAYHQRINRNSTLSIGMSGGIISYALLGDQLRTPDGDYDEPNINHQDPTLPTTTITQTAPTMDVGLYYKSQVIQAGVGIQQINAGEITFNSMNFGNIGLTRNYFTIFAAELDLNSDWKLLPSVLCKTDALAWQTDLSILTQPNDNIYFGLTFRGYNARSIDALAFLGGVFINDQLFIQYAYDLPLSALRAVQTGSHEIGITYRLNGTIGNGKLPGVIYNPRRL